MRNRLEDLFTAVTFAEAGEFATARELAEPKRNVLLALDGQHVEPRALNCASNLCERVDASLDVLLLLPAEGPPAPAESALDVLKAKGIPYRIIRRQGSLGAEVLRHVREHRNVLFVVIDSLTSWGAKDRAARPWERLACPLVIANEGCGKNS